MASASENEKSIEIENVELFDEIVELLQLQESNRGPEVIMLIGKTGVGKSAMINTIASVLTGRECYLVKTGKGKSSSVTLDLKRFETCGLDVRFIRDKARKEKIEAVLPKLPRIVDCAGLGDENTPKIREILELLVGGFVPNGKNIKALEALQKKHGIGCLKNVVFKKANPGDKVTKIIFMHSCNDSVPKNLINCLSEVLQIVNPSNMETKYTAEIFLLIAKYDLVRDPFVHISTESDSNSITLEDFVKMEEELASELNIEGALDANRIRWASYSDKLKSPNKYIENCTLRFLKRMVQPGNRPAEEGEPVIGLMETLKLYLFSFKNQLKRSFFQDMQVNLSPALLVAAIVFVVVLAVLYKLLTSAPL